MTDRMTNTSDRIEIITSVQRRRRWTAAEKMRLVERTFAPGMTVSLVARQNGIAPNQLFTWRRLAAQGALTATGAEEEVVPASDYRALQNQIRELQGSFLHGWPTTTKCTRTRRSATDHLASSSRPNPPRDPVLLFGGNNKNQS